MIKFGLTSLLAGGNSNGRTQDQWKFHDFFMNTPGYWPLLEFPHVLSLIFLENICPQPLLGLGNSPLPCSVVTLGKWPVKEVLDKNNPKLKQKNWAKRKKENRKRKNKDKKSSLLIVAMSASAQILSADFPHVMAAGHTEDFQIYVLERPWHLS